MRRGRFSLRRRKFVKSLLLTAIAPLGNASAAISWTGKVRMMQGPMAGAVSPTSFSVWVRTGGEQEVSLEYWPAGQGERRTAVTDCSRTARKADFTALIAANDLLPATDYRYRVLLNGEPDPYLAPEEGYNARTAPQVGSTESFGVAFGSCPHFRKMPIQPIWSAIESQKPRLFLWLGDNIYADSLLADVLAEEYRRQRDVPNLQPLLRSVPQLAIWDDHDYGLNDHDRRNPVKHEALQLFKHYWANPGYGLSDVPGVFFKYSYGAVDFFFLDDRFHRDPIDTPDSPDKTMLGAGQKHWLKTGLETSKAIFKVLVAGNGWTDAKGPGQEAWSSFLHERNEIFDFICERRIDGVVLLSGDTHIGELNCIPWSDLGGYDFYEFVSSPLAQEPAQSWRNYRPIIRVRDVYDAGSNFGFLEFNFDSSDPEIRFRLLSDVGEPAWPEFRVALSEISGHRQTWPGKVRNSTRRAPTMTAVEFFNESAGPAGK
jgi:alkaline phosphatase D